MGGSTRTDGWKDGKSFVSDSLILCENIFKPPSLLNRTSYGLGILNQCSPHPVCHMSGVRCPVSGVKCQMSSVRCQVSGVS